MPMNLVIDAGNTTIKMAVFKDDKILFKDRFLKRDFVEKISKTKRKYPGITHAIISSVTRVPKRNLNALTSFSNILTLTGSTWVPFKNKYATPESLGTDRIALATAAYVAYKFKNVLVVGTGTCITYDFVNSEGCYLGGAIAPGLRMRYKALHAFTAKLPLLETGPLIDFIGGTTEESLHSGVINGITNEIDATILQYKQRFKDLTVILTGGDADFLSKRLKNSIFAHSNFLLEGLNYILEYNKH